MGHFYINKKSNTVFSFRFEIHLHILHNLFIIFWFFWESISFNTKSITLLKIKRVNSIVLNILKTKPQGLGICYYSTNNNLPVNVEAKSKKDLLERKLNPHWVSGFVDAEGEGSFSVRRGSSKFELLFSISQSVKDEILMDAIKQFFENLPGTHGLDIVKKSIYNPKGVNHQPVIQLVISQTDYIKNVLIQFFSSLEWHSKKELDFNDWVIIFNLKERGHHYQEEGLRVLNTIVNQMNNSRLSTSKNISIDRDQLLKDIAILLNGPSNYEIIGDRKIIKSLNKLAGVGKQVIIQLEDENGNVIKTLYSILDCAKFFKVSRTLIYSRLSYNKSVIFEGKHVFITKK